MTPHDSRDSDRDTGRQKPRRNRVTRDSANGSDATTVAARDSNGKPIPTASKTGKGAASGRHLTIAPETLSARVEFVIIPSDTQEGREFHKRQAMAVLRALRWFAEHPGPNGGPKS